jgi:hypothetical protein
VHPKLAIFLLRPWIDKFPALSSEAVAIERRFQLLPNMPPQFARGILLPRMVTGRSRVTEYRSLTAGTGHGTSPREMPQVDSPTGIGANWLRLMPQVSSANAHRHAAA